MASEIRAKSLSLSLSLSLSPSPHLGNRQIFDALQVVGHVLVFVVLGDVGRRLDEAVQRVGARSFLYQTPHQLRVAPHGGHMQSRHAELVADVGVGSVTQQLLRHFRFVLEDGNVQRRGVRVLEMVIAPRFEPLLYLLQICSTSESRVLTARAGYFSTVVTKRCL